MQTIKREFPGLIKLAYPLVLTQLAQFGIVFTDVVMMGLIGPEALAGAGLGGAVFSLLLIFSTGLITVLTNQVTSHLQDKTLIQQFVHTGLFLSFILFIIFGSLLWNIKPILIMLGQQQIVVDTASLYLKALMWGMLPNLFYMTLRAFTIGVLQPQLISVITIGAMVLNIILNLAFIYAFPNLGVINLGIASSLVFFAMFIVLVINILLNKKLKGYKLFRDFKFFYPKLIYKLLRLGIPMGMIFTFEGGFFILGTFMAGLFGTTSLAAHHIAMQLSILTYMVTVGIANATSVMVSQAYGLQQFNRVHSIGRAGVCLGLLWMSVPSILFLLSPKPFIYLFTYFNMEQMQEVISVAIGLLMIAAAFQLFDGLQGITFSILRGIEEGFKPMLIAIIGYWCVGAPLAYLFAFVFDWGIQGVWWGLACGLATTGLLGWSFFEWRIARLQS